MRPNNQNKNRQRSRNGGRKHVNPLSRNFESNGPDVKVRGNAAHIAEKYLQLARDAQSSGDSVMAENYLQHAEHYFRIVASAQQAQNGQRPDGQSQDDDFDDDMPEMNSRFASPQPIQQPNQQGDGDEQGEGDRSEQPQQQQQGERNNDRGDRQRRDRQERPRQERPRQERPAEQQEQPQIAAVAAEPIAESDSEASAEQQADGEARKPRRPRRRRPAGGDAGDPAGAPQPDVGELPAFLTGKAATAAE
jgi:hypothetical protein